MQRRPAAVLAPLLLSGLLASAAAHGQDPHDPCAVGRSAILAANSVRLAADVVVHSGDVVVNDPHLGPTLGPGFALYVDRRTSVSGSLKADTIRIFQQSSIGGDVFFNTLNNSGSIGGNQVTPLSLPVFATLPPFVAADPRGPASNVLVAAGQSVTLDAGDFADIVVEAEGSVVFSGGIYNVGSLDVAADDGSLFFQAPSEIRIEGKLRTRRRASIGPATGSGISPSDIVFYVAGINGTTGALNATPEAARIGAESTASANFYVPNGTLRLESQTVATGAFLGRDVQVDSRAQVSLASAFANLPPVADPQTVTVAGLDPVEILLTASDPEGSDLAFSIETHPTQGTLSDLTEIVPDPVEDPENPGTFVQPPISSATVTYTPSGPVENDGFTFAVTDGCGNTGMAVVSINPFDPTPPPPPLQTVIARDVVRETTVDTAVTIALLADAPEGVAITLSVVSLPSGALQDSTGQAIEAVPYTLPDATLTYTPPSAFTGEDSFFYEASGEVEGMVQTDTATVTVAVGAPLELAEDQEVETFLNQPVKVVLTGNPGGTATGTSSLLRTKLVLKALPGATIAGNVSDADGDGLGDGRDDLPGAAPVLVAAAVDVNLSSQTFDGEAAFLAALAHSDSFDFETGSGFPPSGSLIGLFQGIDFDAQTFATSQATSGSQTMTGSGGTFTAAILDFAGLELKPSAFGFFALDLTVGEVIRVTVDYAAGPDDVFDVGLAPGDPAFTPTYFGFFDSARVIDRLTFFGTDSGGGARAWLIDDLSLGRRSRVAGVARIQVEWDLGSLPTSGDAIEEATVTLHTVKGTVDALDTSFFAGGADQDGLLRVSDFQEPADPLAGVVMPVPAGAQTGDEGTFSFKVTAALKGAVDAGFGFFSLQGRVDESLAGQGFQRGLQVRSTASGNLAQGREPQLEVVTADTPVEPQLLWTITTLPSNGTLRTVELEAVTVGQMFTEAPTLVYFPAFGFSGTDSFTYRVTEGSVIDSALVSIFVSPDDGCAEVGRPPGCSPSGP